MKIQSMNLMPHKHQTSILQLNNKYHFDHGSSSCQRLSPCTERSANSFLQYQKFWRKKLKVGKIYWLTQIYRIFFHSKIDFIELMKLFYSINQVLVSDIKPRWCLQISSSQDPTVKDWQKGRHIGLYYITRKNVLIVTCIQ